MGHLYHLLQGSESITKERQKEYESDDGKECYKILSSGYNVTMVPLNFTTAEATCTTLEPNNIPSEGGGTLMVPSLPEEQLIVASRKDIFLNDFVTDKFFMGP